MRPHGKLATVDPTDPTALAQCDRCGLWRNLPDLVEQTQWAGQQLVGTQVLVCRETTRCFDIPNEQLRTIILPPDPPPVLNARVPDFAYEEAGPVQSTLTADVARGAVLLPVEDATGFAVGNTVWVQLANASFAQCQITGVDTTNNIVSVLSPLPYAAPNTGVVSVASS